MLPEPRLPGIVRLARASDQEAVIAIRDDAIRTSLALWIDTVPERAEARAWFEAHLHRGTMIVADLPEYPGEAVGYASFSPLREYDGYRETAEDSVYLSMSAQGRGLGRALLEALAARARDHGMHSLVGMIEAGNVASIALHERCGFVETGRIPQAGLKHGLRLDLVIMQLLLRPGIESRPPLSEGAPGS